MAQMGLRSDNISVPYNVKTERGPKLALIDGSLIRLKE